MRFLTAGVAGLLVAALLVTGTGVAAADTGTPVDGGATMGTSETPQSVSGPPGATVRSAAAAVANPVASVVTLTPGITGFDNIGADSASKLSCLNDAGYSFDVLDALTSGWDTEYRAAAALGMSVVLFQGFYQPYWSDPNQGTARGQLMVGNAQSVGYPQGAQVFLNLENNQSDGTNPVSRATMIQWVQNWVAAVTAAGYVPGIYVGVPQLLSTADLDTALPQNVVFWRSASGSAPQTSRGYVLRQPTINTTACGVSLDTDVAGTDNRGAALVGAGFSRAATTPTVPGAFGPLTPARILDTRLPGYGGALPPLGVRPVQILGAGGVPATGVSAVVVNITAVTPTAGGYLTVWPSGVGQPTVSNLNFNPGQNVPNLAVIPVGNDGKIQVFNGSGGNTDLIIDVAGYYLGGTPTTPGALGALTPARILDTRLPGSSGALPAVTGQALKVLGVGGVPATGVSAVVMNVTVVNPTVDGYITAFPSDKNRPTASNLNFVAGQVVANLVVLPVGADGKVLLFNGSGGSTDLIADVVGYIKS